MGMELDDDPLTFLLALNGKLAIRDDEDQPVTGPGLPPAVEDPGPFVTTDCIRADEETDRKGQ
jgi:hypothetical protein